MLRNSQRFRSVVYIYYPFPMNGTIQESRIIPSIIIVPKTILRTKIARAIQTPAYYHNNQRNTSPRNERRKKIFQKKKISFKYSHHERETTFIHRYPPAFFHHHFNGYSECSETLCKIIENFLGEGDII